MKRAGKKHSDADVTVSPDILSGTPVFKGTRVPIKNLFDYLEGGESLDAFLDDFPIVTRERAIRVLERSKTKLIESSV